VSRIDALINELCPSGVVFEELGTVAELRRGTSITKGATIQGSVPVVAGGRTPAYFHSESNRSGETIVVAGSGAYAGFVSFWTIPIYVSDAFTVAPHSDAMLPRYCFHLLKSHEQSLHRMKTGGGVPHLYPRDLTSLRVPLPPLEVQSEIVKVLDKFADLEAGLEAELEAELVARQRQYSHYRDTLLAFERESHWATLDDLAENLDSRRRPVTKSDRVPGDFPYYGASGIVDYVSEYIFEGDHLLVSEDGANLLARTTPIAFSISGKAWVNNHAHVLRFATYVEQRFVEIYLNSIDLSPYISGGPQPKLNQANLNRIPIPVPPLVEQQRIVTILDKLDALVKDLSIGLPAELNARREQYEHYRDRLVTFREAA
jgi:type I restriction enzyme S subunit